MGDDGALKAAIQAREEGLVRFIGVTGHGVMAPVMHRRSLERFAFDSVLLPYNYLMMQNPEYAADWEALAAICGERKVALQTIKSLTEAPVARGHRSLFLHLVRALRRTGGYRPGCELGPGRPARLPQHHRRYPRPAEASGRRRAPYGPP